MQAARPGRLMLGWLRHGQFIILRDQHSKVGRVSWGENRHALTIISPAFLRLSDCLLTPKMTRGGGIAVLLGSSEPNVAL